MLTRVSTELKGNYVLDKIYRIVLESISQSMKPEMLTVFLYNEEKGVLEDLVEYRGGKLDKTVEEIFEPDQSLTGWVFTNRKPLRSAEPTKDIRYNDALGKKLINRLPSHQFVHYLGAPLILGKKILGVIRAVNKKSEYYEELADKTGERALLTRGFSDDCENILKIAANHLAVALENARIHQEMKQWIEKLTKLNEIMQRMTEMRSVDELLELILDRAQQLIDFKYGLITRVDLVKGKQQFVAHCGDYPEYHSLPLWEGIMGKALKDMEPMRVDDVQGEPWQKLYRKRWEDTRSELAVPILINSVEVRIGRKIDFKPKFIGVINLESSIAGNFSKSDEDILVLLARHAAIMIERLEYEDKLASLSQMERDIAGRQDWDEIIRIVMQTITNTLGYEYVNISLVDRERNCIKTEYITGIPEKDIELFKKMANHSLESDDIQAHIVRDREIEVPDCSDPRFDTSIFKQFRHDHLIRVFIPMITTTDKRVIGTVEAGYQREYRPYIYEEDVQILQDFIDYAVHALELRMKGLLDRISHEFRAPIVGIRSNASFLFRRYRELDNSDIERKLRDIRTDSDLLLYQVKELEYILGRTPPVSKRERTFLFRDIIIKTIEQFRPLLTESSLRSSKIKCDPDAVSKVEPLYIDRAKINQVVYNLLMNSLKYAEEDSNQFKVRISVDNKGDSFCIIFRDWGIGVREDFIEKIFNEGFRAPEAVHKNVTGSGLGLTISRKIMREMGGDLLLTSRYKPTEFQIILPKKLMEISHDTVH
jgi:signal transduction histidine kinase/putative methionine-R-sulfoxide reductase with GAF domain